MIKELLKWLRKKHILCTYVKKAAFVTKNICFGFSGCETQGMYISEKCKICDKERKISLNLCMPEKYLKPVYSHMWKKINEF